MCSDEFTVISVEAETTDASRIVIKMVSLAVLFVITVIYGFDIFVVPN